MPIRFSCPQCSQKLSVSTRKAGTRANCPRCNEELTVPGTPVPIKSEESSEEAATPSAMESAGSASLASPPLVPSEGVGEDDPYAQFVVYDDTDLVYEEGASGTPVPVVPERARRKPSIQDQIALPRYVLYTQGLLIGAVGLFCFTLGVLTGGTFFSSSEGTTVNRPCDVSGTISYLSGGRTLPDEGAVVVVLPQTEDVGQRIKPQGLRPDEPLGELPPEGAEQIRNMGGAYARADDKGQFQVHLASGGKYYVLVLSSHVRRGGDDIVKTDDVAKLGRFIESANDLLADSRYEFRTESIRGDRKLNEVFD